MENNKNSLQRIVIADISADMLSTEPGIYIFRSKAGIPLYIGKAKNLKNRIKQYLQLHDNRPLIPFLLEEAYTVDCIIAATENEALILENNLIKENRPKYNIDLKDDKTFPYIALTKDNFPQLIITRKPWQKHRFIKGPFTHAKLLRQLMKVLLDVFPLRKCKTMSKKGCINKQIGICIAPCVGSISMEKYDELVKRIIELLQGKGWREFTAYIKDEIEKAAETLHFERAARLRDVLDIVPEIKGQLGVELSKSNTEDYFWFLFLNTQVFLSVACFVEGKLNEIKSFHFKTWDNDEQAAVLTSISAFYESHPLPQAFGIFPENLIDDSVVSAVFSVKLKKISIPVKTLLEKNCQHQMDVFFKKDEELNLTFQILHHFLSAPVFSIMCIDVSTFYGEDSVVGAIWWEKGEFVKKNYRRFLVKTVEGINDFASMHEIALRLKNHWETKEWQKPDLLLIDGGTGQISSVYKALGESQTIAGIVKDRGHKKGAEKLINLNGTAISLTNSSFALLFKKIRDEAHRFAIEHNRKRRKLKI